jgi:hypothetical protein
VKDFRLQNFKKNANQREGLGGGRRGNKAKEEFEDIDLLERVVALLPVVRADDRVGREED